MKSPFWLVVSLTVGCGLFGPPDEERTLGRIYLRRIESNGPELPAIEVPKTVVVATSFTVSILTDIACRRGGDTEVLTSDNTTTITVYDFFVRPTGSSACGAGIELFEHLAPIRFDAKGLATVVVRGAGLGLPPSNEIEYEFEVWVE